MTSVLSVTSAVAGSQGSTTAGAVASGKTAASTAGAAQTSDVVNVSAVAQSLAAQSNIKDSSYYQQFMPTRQGFSSAALAQAVVDPSADPFSQGKTTAQVADAARAELDKQYAAMKASGRPYDDNSVDGQDRYSLMGNLDRRALAVVATNAGGKFTKQEQASANSIMLQQQSLATGAYAGPARLAGGWVDPSAADPVGRAQAAINWLDQVSDEEKQTVTWASTRAAAQVSLTVQAPDRDSNATKAMLVQYQTDNPLAKLIATAMSQSGERGFPTAGLRTADDLRQQAWFKGFSDKLNTALSTTKAIYS